MLELVPAYRVYKPVHAISLIRLEKIRSENPRE